MIAAASGETLARDKTRLTDDVDPSAPHGAFGFVVAGSGQALKLEPQPQVPFTFGLLNLKPEPKEPST